MGSSAADGELALLELMLADMEAAPELYRPTRFWREASREIIADLRAQGLNSFRSHPSALKFYVPQYQHAVHREAPQFCEELIGRLAAESRGERRLAALARRFLDGSLEAASDYRVVAAGDSPRPPLLTAVADSLIGNPLERHEFDGRVYSRSMLNYLRGLVFLKKHAATEPIARVLEVGGGFGTLGEILLKTEGEAFFYVNCDIPPLSFVSTWYLQQVFGTDAVADYRVTRDLAEIDVERLRRQYRAAVLCAWQLPRLTGRFDLFVNYFSFQEMEPAVVANYIAQVQRLGPRYALLRNLREGMQRESRYTVDRATVRDDYLAWFCDYQLLASDALVYGERYVDGFHSDLLVFGRRLSG